MVRSFASDLAGQARNSSTRPRCAWFSRRVAPAMGR